MGVVLKNRIVNSYFRLMKNWDNRSKKDLIIKLTESIDDTSKDKFDFSFCFGEWDDDRTADEIIKEVMGDRINKREIEDF